MFRCDLRTGSRKDFDFDHLTTKPGRDFEGIGQPSFYSRPQHQAIDDQVDFVQRVGFDADLL